MKSIFEQNGETYTKAGDYYIPNIPVPNTSLIKLNSLAELLAREFF